MIFMLGAIELLASVGMVLGFYIQLSALLLSIVMIGAAGMKMIKWKVPFVAGIDNVIQLYYTSCVLKSIKP